MSKCSTLIIKEMQIKTMMKFHSTLNILAKIKKTDNTKCCQGYKVIGSLMYR